MNTEIMFCHEVKGQKWTKGFPKGRMTWTLSNNKHCWRRGFL